MSRKLAPPSQLRSGGAFPFRRIGFISKKILQVARMALQLVIHRQPVQLYPLGVIRGKSRDWGFVFRNAPDSGRKRAMPALTLSARSGHGGRPTGRRSAIINIALFPFAEMTQESLTL